MNHFNLLIFCLLSVPVWAQPTVYTVSNAHSHNDYEQTVPFWRAYSAGFGSIEADIFYVEGSELLVAHTTTELAIRKRRLDSLYLIPLVACIRKNHGTVYADPSKTLQLMVDIKTAAVPTLNKLIETINRFPELTNASTLRFTISGNRPDPDSFKTYPSYITFDGELSKTYDDDALSRISMMSASIKNYTPWNGKDPVNESDLYRVKAEIAKSHRLSKPIRFWEAPDDINAWNVLRRLGVDYINTDHIEALAAFLRGFKKRSKS